MKTSIKILTLASLFLAAMVITSQAVPEHEHHHPDPEGESSAHAKPELMHGMPCRLAGAPCNGPCMTTAVPPSRHHINNVGMPDMMPMDHGMMDKKAGMMQQRMDREFFLDQVKNLGLTPDQVARLKAIRSDCRKDNLRSAAEVRILRFDLKDLLDVHDWGLQKAEALIRKIQDLEGDMLVRHLQSLSEARDVLSVEQLKKAYSSGEDDIESLFK